MKKIRIILYTILLLPLNACMHNFKDCISSGVYGCSDTITLRDVKTSIRHGIDVNHVYSHNFTPLIYAIYYNKPEIVKFLIKSGAKINMGEKSNNKALTFAVNNNNLEITKILIKAGASVKKKAGTNLLMKAIDNGSIPMLKLLVNAGTDLDFPDYRYESPLLHAIKAENKQMILYLAKSGAKVDDEIFLWVCPRDNNTQSVRLDHETFTIIYKKYIANLYEPYTCYRP